MRAAVARESGFAGDGATDDSIASAKNTPLPTTNPAPAIATKPSKINPTTTPVTKSSAAVRPHIPSPQSLDITGSCPPTGGAKRVGSPGCRYALRTPARSHRLSASASMSIDEQSSVSAFDDLASELERLEGP
jgi:hypothetical protein